MTLRKIIIDTDPGHDDALAIMLATPHLDVLGVTTVAGNQSIDKVTRNALQIVELIKRTDIPVAQGMSRPLVRTPKHAALAHGQTGMDGVTLPPPTTPLIQAHAVDFLIDTLLHRDDVTLVPIGPLTNIAAALHREPRIAARIREISLMGGSTTQGNITPAAEFNIWFDPEAAHTVFTSGVPIRMCGLNLTHQVIAGPEERQRIDAVENSVAKCCTDLLAFYADPQHITSGARSGAWHDPCAVASLIDESLIEFQPMHVAVELKGQLTYGMTVCDGRHLRGSAFGFPDAAFAPRGNAPNAQVAVRIDRARFFDLFCETLNTYG